MKPRPTDKFSNALFIDSRAMRKATRSIMGAIFKPMMEETYRYIASSLREPTFAIDARVEDIISELNRRREYYLNLMQTKGTEYIEELLKAQQNASTLAVRRALMELRKPPKQDDEDESSIFPLLAFGAVVLLDLLETNKLEFTTEMKSQVNRYYDQTIGTIARAEQFKPTLATAKRPLTTAIPQAQSTKVVNETLKQVKEVAKKNFARVERTIGDQTHKAFVSVSSLLAKENGIRRFQWIHTYTGKYPRVYHRDVLNGNVYDIDNPPVIDPRTGTRGLPAQLPYCRCVMRLVE